MVGSSQEITHPDRNILFNGRGQDHTWPSIHLSSSSTNYVAWFSLSQISRSLFDRHYTYTRQLCVQLDINIVRLGLASGFPFNMRSMDGIGVGDSSPKDMHPMRQCRKRDTKKEHTGLTGGQG